ncbi:hypothetical protein V6Z12_D04G086900 [Gossypium hirsutum]
MASGGSETRELLSSLKRPSSPRIILFNAFPGHPCVLLILKPRPLEEVGRLSQATVPSLAILEINCESYFRFQKPFKRWIKMQGRSPFDQACSKPASTSPAIKACPCSNPAAPGPADKARSCSRPVTFGPKFKALPR